MQRPGITQSAPVAQTPGSRQRQSAFIPVREMARTLNVSEMTIRRAYAAGVIPGITFGSTCRVLRAFVESLVAAVESGQQIKVEEFGRQWTIAARNGAVA